ncbi:aminotransferase class I/II-fold pyridoxal phosphate-dependent enzyme [Candidatus Vidania fulgoroideorum]
MKINLGLGEPKQKFVYLKNNIKKSFLKNIRKLNEYPIIEGKRGFRESISKWINKRNNLKKNFTKNIAPSIGNKEAIYTITNLVTNIYKKNTVISPDPYYPSYIIAKLFFRKKIMFINSKDKNSFMSNFRKIKNFKNILMILICSPNNPLGYCLNRKDWIEIINVSINKKFIILSDECYSEIYTYKKPISCIKIIEERFDGNYNNIYVINSLSKTSSVPGLRSGFILSSKNNIKKINSLRKYNGSNLSNLNQYLSSKLWLDFNRTKKIRKSYKKIFKSAKKIFDTNKIKFNIPEGGFCIWLDIKKTGYTSEKFCKIIKKKYNIIIYPGSQFSNNKRSHYKIRISLVESKKKCIFALKKILFFVNEKNKKNNK